MPVPYSLIIIWHQPFRYFPAMFAVAFSGVLSALECAMLLGILDIAARPVKNSSADLWVASPEVRGYGFGRPIPVAWRARLLSEPEVLRVEQYLCSFALFERPDGSTDQCGVVGMRLEVGSLGAMPALPSPMRQRLTQPGTAVVYASELNLLGMQEQAGEVGAVAAHRVTVVGFISTGEGAGLIPGLYCSLRTARGLLPNIATHQTSYLLARCRSPEESARVARRLRARYSDMATLTSAELAWQTQRYWLVRTRAGLVLGFTAALGLFVGVIVTSQTLYGATLAAQREFAVLRALGIPRWRLRSLVLGQSFWVTVFGLIAAFPLTEVLGSLARSMRVEVLLPGWLLAGIAGLMLVIGLLSGLAALRSLRGTDPVILLR